MHLIKKGIFWRVVVGEMMSKKRFLRAKSAFRYYYQTLDRHGMPVENYKRKEKDACKKSRK